MSQQPGAQSAEMAKGPEADVYRDSADRIRNTYRNTNEKQRQKAISDEIFGDVRLIKLAG